MGVVVWHTHDAMAQALPATRSAFAEYLALEEKAETKHEYVNGEIVAIAGGTATHARLAAELIGDLWMAVKDRPCAVYTSDMRIRIQATRRATYRMPPWSADRSNTTSRIATVRSTPSSLVEVLSDSSEARDLRDRFVHYRRIPSLRHDVLVWQPEPRIEWFTRGEDGVWSLHEAGKGGDREARSHRVPALGGLDLRRSHGCRAGLTFGLHRRKLDEDPGVCATYGADAPSRRLPRARGSRPRVRAPGEGGARALGVRAG